MYRKQRCLPQWQTKTHNLQPSSRLPFFLADKKQNEWCLVSRGGLLCVTTDKLCLLLICAHVHKHT